MLPLLEQRFDVLAVDLPGFGRSEPFPPSVDSTPEALADAVAGAWTAGARHRPVPDDGAARAADALAGLLVATVRG